MIFAWGCVVAAQTQDEMAEMSTGGLLSAAGRSLSAEDYGTAILYLTEYLERMDGMDDDRVMAMTQAVRLKLGQISAYLEDPAAAVKYLKQYTENLPCYRPREAWKLLALNYYESGQFLQSISAVTNALARPLPKELPGKSTKVNYDELSKEEMAGFTARQIKRLEREAADAGTALSESISSDRPDAEPDFTSEELVLLNMTLAESYSNLENWQASVEPYQYVIEHAGSGDRKGYATMQLVNSLIALKEFEEVQSLIFQLYRTDARYDIRVNMALMSAAAALFDEEQFDSSLMLYRMVLPRDELVAHQEQKMNLLRRKAGLPNVDIQIRTNEFGRVESLFGNKFADISSEGSDFAEGLPPKPMELIKLEESVGVLVSLPPYEDDVVYRMGLAFMRAGRPWEAVAALDTVAKRDPDGDKGQLAFADSLMVRIDPLEKYERVEELGKQFLKQYAEGLGPRRVAHALTVSYQKQEKWKEIKALLPIIEQFGESDDSVTRQYECELFYMQAIADMVLLNYKVALAGFDRVLIEFPNSHQQESSTYWHAMAQLFLKNHQDALDEFTEFSKSWPESDWLPSVAFHSGLCLFGMEQYEEAKVRFTQVIDTWPDEPICSDARSMRGDLYAADGALDEAQSDYEAAIASAREVRQATYPVFQMASMFELEERYDEILAVVGAYLDRYGEEADIAKAAFWIGKTKLAQGRYDEAVSAYLDAILKYGNELRQDGVDLIINELIGVARSRLDEAQQQALEKNLQISLAETERVPLQLRLRVLLASIEGEQLELGQQLIDELDDLEQAPPPALALICDASFAQQNYSRGEEMLTLFLNRYEDSEYMGSAYKLRGFQLFDEGRYPEALEIAQEAQALYGTELDAVWAQIMKGRIEQKLGRVDEARKALRAVLSVRDWRGEPYAEATYYLGELEESTGDLRQAFAWYQRAYIQYKGYANGYWAAEGYLASARCLKGLGMEVERLNTYRAMLFDRYVNTLPQADTARKELGAEVAQGIDQMIAQGLYTNVVVKLSAEGSE